MENLALKKEIKFRATRRGLKETCMLFEGFVNAHLDDLSDAQLKDFRDLTLETDQDLLIWLIEEKPAPAEKQTEIFNMVKDFARTLFTVKGVS